MNKVYIGIGKTREQKVPAEVLRHSISVRTQLQLHYIDLSAISENDCHKGNTPFSLQRFLFAEAVVNEEFDVAIYLDSDMCVFSDINNLVINFINLNVSVATCAAPEKFLRKNQSSVMIFNSNGARLLCERLFKYKQNNLSYKQLLYLEDFEGWGKISKDWNCLEYFDANTRLIHWTDMDSQPWLRGDNYLGGLWVHALREWCNSDKKNYALMMNDVRKGFLRPSLIEAIQPPFGSHITIYFKIKDLFFLPPHRFSRIPSLIRKLFTPLLKLVINLNFFLRGKKVNENNG
jgi:hypothetical protein